MFTTTTTPRQQESPSPSPTDSVSHLTVSGNGSADTIAAAAPDPRSPKLRSSCDACGSSKVRCDRTQPQCARCRSSGITCVYGVSRKFGKPPRKKPAINRIDSALQSAEIHEIGIPNLDITHLNFSDLVGHENDISFSPNPSTSVASHQNNIDLASALFTPLPLEQWLQSDVFPFGLDTELSEYNNHSRNNCTTSTVPEPTTTARATPAHDCQSDAYEILRGLSLRNGSYIHSNRQSDTPSAQLDRVLHSNREAIHQLTCLLKCPCSRSPHLAMLYGSIISRIIIWYQQAAGCRKSNAWRPSSTISPDATPSTASTSSSSSAPQVTSVTPVASSNVPTISQVTGFVVSPMPMTMGVLNIDDQGVQAILRGHLVLSELKRVAALIDVFASQGSGSCGANGVDNLYTTLGAWLRAEHSRTIRVIKTLVGTPNEDAGF
ncbi:hypothetical protein F4801DRAFT_314446 [Xylaria longipes]|nr:hypothetical protein F4801DRAFT_314446 [Xylaria longipes]